MPSFLFWTFALVMIGFGAAVIISRNPIASALSLVVSFLGLSVLFVSLNAFFIGVIQVLVYAGAVMVLFLFIIMLLDLRAEKIRKINWLTFGGGVLVSGPNSCRHWQYENGQATIPAPRLFAHG